MTDEELIGKRFYDPTIGVVEVRWIDAGTARIYYVDHDGVDASSHIRMAVHEVRDILRVQNEPDPSRYPIYGDPAGEYARWVAEMIGKETT